METCPCGTGKEYNSCCKPYLEDDVSTPTAESTMRARYSAFALGKIDFVESSHDPATRSDFNKEEVAKWSEDSKWLGLSIKKTEAGTENDDDGKVEFICRYEIEGVVQNHHELSEFKKVEGKWYFHDSQVLPSTVERSMPKVGRNDPCPCGSGKKFKKCCMR